MFVWQTATLLHCQRRAGLYKFPPSCAAQLGEPSPNPAVPAGEKGQAPDRRAVIRQTLSMNRRPLFTARTG